MLKEAFELLRRIPPSVIYLNFAVLLVLATLPTWRFLVFGFTLEDLLQLRCF